MADDIKQLNKTVTEAVNILKLYVGNSGQIKAKTEKEQKVIDGWLNVVDMSEEREKRQRAFTERERDENGRFIKKREGSWGNFLDMAESGMKMFNKITFGVVGKFTSAIKNIVSSTARIFSEIKGHFLSLFGEESEWFGLLSAIKDSITGFASSIIGWIWKKSPNWAKKMISYLGSMYKLQIKQMKIGFLEAGGKKGKEISIMGTIGALVFAIAAGIGAFMHRYFILLTKLPIFGKVLKLFTKIEGIPFIGKLFKSLKFGFRIFGWPLTLLLSVIDFIKGFKNTEIGLWEKIKNGLWSALNGFIELPIKFIGWVVEKIAGFFGVELNSVGDKILEYIKKGFGFILDISPLQNITKFFEGFFGADGTFSEKLISGFKGGFENIINLINSIWNSDVVIKIKSIFTKGFENIVNFIDNMITGLMDFVINSIPGGPGSVGGWIKDLLGKSNKENTPTINPTLKKFAINDTRELENEKIKSRMESDKKFLDSMKNLWSSTKEAFQNTNNAINGISNIQNNGGGGGDVRQIPDELDNALMGVGNYNGAMD